MRVMPAWGIAPRATLAVETGLNKSTVSSLVADLIEAGLLRDSPIEERPAKVGRPPEVHFGWTDDSPVSGTLGFLLFGEGNVPWMVRDLVRHALAVWRGR